jgi:hypothetical protein
MTDGAYRTVFYGAVDNISLNPGDASRQFGQFIDDGFTQWQARTTVLERGKIAITTQSQSLGGTANIQAVSQSV